jgi:hypothetical protein
MISTESGQIQNGNINIFMDNAVLPVASRNINSSSGNVSVVQKKHYFNYTISANGNIYQAIPLSFNYEVRAVTGGMPVLSGPKVGNVSISEGLKFMKDFSYMDSGDTLFEISSVSDERVNVWMLQACGGEAYADCVQKAGGNCTVDTATGLVLNRRLSGWSSSSIGYVVLSDSDGATSADALRFVSNYTGEDVVVDNSNASPVFSTTSGTWNIKSGGYGGSHLDLSDNSGPAEAVWMPELKGGNYHVYAWVSAAHDSGHTNASEPCGNTVCPARCAFHNVSCVIQQCQPAGSGSKSLIYKNSPDCSGQCPAGFSFAGCVWSGGTGSALFYTCRPDVCPSTAVPSGWTFYISENCGDPAKNIANCSWELGNASYKIYHDDGTVSVVVNQSSNPGSWVLLGVYNLPPSAGVLKEVHIEKFNVSVPDGYPGSPVAGMYSCPPGCNDTSSPCCARMASGDFHADGAAGMLKVYNYDPSNSYMINYMTPVGQRACAYTSLISANKWSGNKTFSSDGQYALYGSNYVKNFSEGSLRAVVGAPSDAVGLVYSVSSVSGDVAVSFSNTGQNYLFNASVAVPDFYSALILPLENFGVMAPSTGIMHTLKAVLLTDSYTGIAMANFTLCTDADNDSHCLEAGDCADTNLNVHPGAVEVCDGLDNDCNGQTDEGCSCTDSQQRNCGTDVGECEFGTQTCSGGSWGECTGAVEPEEERCNGKDDDCDGGIDDDFECARGSEKPCGSNIGVCTAGMQKCSSRCKWGDCTGGVKPLPEEVCGNGEDDDCDSETDEIGCISASSYVCDSGPVPESGCRCGGETYNIGFCCNDVYQDTPCVGTLGLPLSPWNMLVVTGLIILVVVCGLYFYLRSKGRELSWESLEEKWGRGPGGEE